MEKDKYNHDEEALGYQKIERYDEAKITSVASHYKDILTQLEILES